MSQDNFAIWNLQQIVDLWTRTYNEDGKADWSHLLPYYADDIHFVDTVQEIHGISEFRAMLKRLAQHSGELHMNVQNAQRSR